MSTARVAFRDRAVVDVLDLALRFVVVQGRSYAKVAALVLVPALTAMLAAGRVLGWPLAWALALPIALAAEVPFTVLASRLVFEPRVRVREVLGASLRAFPRLFVVRALSLLTTALGLVFLVAPGLWIAGTLFFAGEVFLLERGPAALVRTQRLAGLAVADTVLGVGLLALVPAAAVLLADVAGRAILGELLQITPPEPIWQTAGGTLACLGLVLQVPYRATARFFLYLNVRTRVEGWDIQTRFARLARVPEEP